jgi:iron complex outermembrane receptor protein
VPYGAGAPVSIDGGPGVTAETARVFELGYRRQHGTSLSYAASAYVARYDRLRTLEPVGPASVQFQNRAEGLARGIELWGRWQPRAGWRLDAGLVVQGIDTRPRAGSFDLTTATGLGSNDAHHYWSLRSAHELGHGLQLDAGLRRVGALPQPAVPAYSELDARLLWRARPDLDLALAGVNLLHARHLEFRPGGARQLAERAIQLQLALRF